MVKLQLTIKDAKKLQAILNKTSIEKPLAMLLETILLNKINIAIIDEYTDKLCYGIKQ